MGGERGGRGERGEGRGERREGRGERGEGRGERGEGRGERHTVVSTTALVCRRQALKAKFLWLC